jgi:hypothetical protein
MPPSVRKRQLDTLRQMARLHRMRCHASSGMGIPVLGFERFHYDMFMRDQNAGPPS